jgi:hypothetical protein
MDVIVTVHGVSSLGLWRTHIRPEISSIIEALHVPHDYGWVAPFCVMSASALRREEERFYALYSTMRDRFPGIVPSVVAHGFGTYIVCRALQRFEYLEINRLVLCGSIVDADYDWSALAARGRVNRVRNECAGDDPIVRKLRWRAVRRSLPGTGPSGLDGFARPCPALEQPRFDHYRASKVFITREHCRESWIPFLRSTEAFARLCAVCWREPHNDAAQQRFDELYGALLDAYIGRGATAHRIPQARRHDYRFAIRRSVIRDGMGGQQTPERTIRIATEAYLERIDSPNGHPGSSA